MSSGTEIGVKPSRQRRKRQRDSRRERTPDLQACVKATQSRGGKQLSFLPTPAATAEVSGAVGAVEKHSYFWPCWNCLRSLEALWRKGNKLRKTKRSPDPAALKSLGEVPEELQCWLRSCAFTSRAQFKKDTNRGKQPLNYGLKELLFLSNYTNSQGLRPTHINQSLKR